MAVLDYGDETVIQLPMGAQLRVSAFPEPCSYVRITDQDNDELLYWICDEWQEDPMEVMGAIVGAMNSTPDEIRELTKIR